MIGRGKSTSSWSQMSASQWIGEIHHHDLGGELHHHDLGDDRDLDHAEVVIILLVTLIMIDEWLW